MVLPNTSYITDFFLWILEIFSEQLYYRLHRTSVSYGCFYLVQFKVKCWRQKLFFFNANQNSVTRIFQTQKFFLSSGKMLGKFINENSRKMLIDFELTRFSVNIYLFKFNIKNTNKICEICSKLTIKISERGFWYI